MVDADYVKRLLKYDKLCHHLHLSAQSGSSQVLAAMNRPYDREAYMDIVSDAAGSRSVLRIIDGISSWDFPGEKEADFEDSLQLGGRMHFLQNPHLQVSKRPFTKAASRKGHVAPQVKNRGATGSTTWERSRQKRSLLKIKDGWKRVLLEELLEDQQMITGYTGNYIKVYVPYEDPEAAQGMLNQFVSVELLEVYRDGMRGRWVEK